MKKAKTYILRGISIVLFVTIAVSAFYLVRDTLIMKRTDGITTMKVLYAQPKDSVDLLVLGSSHAGMNLDAGVFWDEYGISSYMLWGSVQPYWNSYYFLEEALKTQSPKVVLLETYASTFDFEYSDDARQITNVCGMKFSLTKWNAIKASTPKENWENFVLGMPLWHSRYGELTENDLSYYPWTEDLELEKGTGIRTAKGGFTALADVTKMTETKPIHEKEELYLRKIIELCKSEDIPIVLYNSATVDRAKEQPYYNRTAEIAREYGLKYFNMNILDNETGILPSDVWQDNHHLNASGAAKLSKYLGRYIDETYNLPDHRKDEYYGSWEAFAKMSQEKRKANAN